MDSPELCELLPWDSDFFQRRIARVTKRQLTADEALAVDAWCEQKSVECLYFLADLDDSVSPEVAVRHGYVPVDVRTTLDIDLTADTGGAPKPVHGAIRVAQPEDIPALEAIASLCHSDTRFYFDRRMYPERCQAFYKTWIRKSCQGYADRVFVAESSGTLHGYITCSVGVESREGQIGLVGVAEEARGRGLGSALVDAGIRWLAGEDCRAVTVVTQGRNIGAQRLYQRCGFMTRSVQLWFHKWFCDD